MQSVLDKNNYRDFVYALFRDTEKDDLEYIYRGEITAKLVMNILDLAKSNLAKGEDTSNLKSRIYFIMGEGLQNITRHQESLNVDAPEKSAIIVINKKQYTYSITTGNLIKKENVEPLKSKLEKINSLTVNELRDFARYVRMTTAISEKGGASLGLIEMAKRSGNKLLFSFKDIDDEFSYFYLNTEIPIYKTKMEILNPQNEKFLEHLKEFHELLNREKFLLSFKGDFNQENLLYLLNIVKTQLTESTTSIKLNNVLVELLQNIVKHADNNNGVTDWKPGIFLINEKDNEFFLTAGNYISSQKIKDFRGKIDNINKLDEKGLSDYYRKNLMDFANPSPIKTGLGIVDMRRKSGRTLDYHFKEINENYSFFTIQVRIDKK
jgi:hypothetical protein